MNVFRTSDSRPHRRGGNIFSHGERSNPIHPLRTLLAIVSAAAMMLGLGLISQTALAADAGVTTTLDTSQDGSFNGNPVLGEGKSVTLKVQYDKETVTPGSTVKIAMDPALVLAGTPSIPDGNKGDITALNVVDGTVEITFADKFDLSTSTQAVFNLNYQVQQVDQSEVKNLTWTVDGVPNTKKVVIVNQGDTPTTVSDSTSKSTSFFNAKVTVGSDGKVSVTAADGSPLVGKTVAYTLNINTQDAVNGYQINDDLPTGMKLDEDSFKVTGNSWDANGLNKQNIAGLTFSPTVTDTGFKGSIDLPANSEVSIAYNAVITQQTVDAMTENLQQQYDNLVQTGDTDGKTIQTSLVNSAYFNGSTQADTASNAYAGYTFPSVSKPDPGKAFSKTEDWNAKTVAPKADGTLDPALPITYTLKADLSQWDGSGTYSTLSQNVIIDDELPSQATWDATDDDFITASGLTLTKVDCADGETASQFVSTAPGSWCVSGQHLLINVGKDKTTNVSIQAKATITTVKDLSNEYTPIQGAKAYNLTNNAQYDYGAANPYKVSATAVLTDLGNTSGGVTDPNTFSKTTGQINSQGQCVSLNGGEIHADPTTHVANLCYIFTVKGVDVTKSTIVDTLDLNTFDSDSIAVSGQYAYWKDMPAEDFTTSLDESTGQLSITLSDAGKALVNATDAGTNQLLVYLKISTKPIVGTQTVDVTNRAKLTGASSSYDYTSSTSASVTTYGASAEVKKYVWDAKNGAWVQNLRVSTDDSGDMTTDEFIYQLKFLPHCDAAGTCYTGIAAIPVVDKLPDGVTFKGFVTNASPTEGVASVNLAQTVQNTVDLGNNNLQASYTKGVNDNGVVTISQKDGTVLENTNPSYAYVLVKVNNPLSQDPITNTIGGNSATIVPGNDYTLNIAKKDSSDLSKEITDENAKFQILGADKSTVVVDDVAVVNGFLRIKDATGNWVAPTVKNAGTYWVKEITPPSGYKASEDLVQVSVGEDQPIGSATVYDSPAPVPSYALGDVVWVDADGDGLQDHGEKPLQGVSVSLTDADGNPVTGVDGKPVAPVATDADGRYLFDGLPAGSYRVSFKLTDDQASRYVFTKQVAGDGSKDNSDGVPDASDASLARTGVIDLGPGDKQVTTGYTDQKFTATQGVDPTWDAGVTEKPVPVVTPSPSPTTTPGKTPEQPGSPEQNGTGKPTSEHSESTQGQNSSVKGNLAKTGAGIATVGVILVALMMAGLVFSIQRRHASSKNND